MSTRLPVDRPDSAVSQRTMLVGLMALAAALAAVKITAPADARFAFLAVLAAIAAAVLLPELTRGRIWEAARSDAASDPAARKRVGIKLAGLAATWAVILIAYGTWPVYRQGGAEVLLGLLSLVAPILLVLTPFYVWLTDLTMSEPEDGCYMAGLAMLGRWSEVDRGMLGQFALGWTVKAFFLPLMLTFAYRDFQWLLGLDVAAAWREGDFGWYELVYRLLYFTETFWAAAGYCLTLKLLDSHIRSTEPTMLGWVVCLACYPPFWPALSPAYFAYDQDGFVWGQWLSGGPKYAWAVAILVLTGIYAWATFSFGARFSNLTHRGIITNGPYRWSKHPAYITKNLTWWMIAVPFVVTGSFADAVRQSLMLLGVNALYYMRARTEERHLSWDPTYRSYAAWIAEHGLLARLKRLVLGRTGASLWPGPQPDMDPLYETRASKDPASPAETDSSLSATVVPRDH